MKIILEAAAQVLETSGEPGFNTNAVAERAGVSVGTLYRYFGNKQQILLALVQREADVLRADFVRLEGSAEGTDEYALKVARLILSAFGGRNRVRKATMETALACLGPARLSEGLNHLSRRVPGRQNAPLTEIQFFVLTRAVIGVVRAAVTEQSLHLLDGDLADQLATLIAGYIERVSSLAEGPT